MDANLDIRWKQRFQNFQKAYLLLENTITNKQLSDAERAGLIKFFEMAFELSWKLMKDYLQEQGFIIASPREALRQAYQSGLVGDGQAWMDALNDRNITVHTYEEGTAREIEARIRNVYFRILTELYDKFLNMSAGGDSDGIGDKSV